MKESSSAALKRTNDPHANHPTGISFDPNRPTDKVTVKDPPKPSNTGGRSYA